MANWSRTKIVDEKVPGAPSWLLAAEKLDCKGHRLRDRRVAVEQRHAHGHDLATNMRPDIVRRPQVVQLGHVQRQTSRRVAGDRWVSSIIPDRDRRQAVGFAPAVE